MLGAGIRMFCLVVVVGCVVLVLREAERIRDRRAWSAAVRTCAGAFGLLAIVGLYWRTLPHEVLACAAFGAFAPALVLGLAMRATLGVTPERSRAHQIVNVAAILLGTGAFAWLVPKLPGIVRLYWSGVHESGYASPSTLWWCLVLLLFNTACMELAYRMLGAGTSRQLAMLRFAESLFTAFDLGIVIVWLGVAADGLPGIVAMRPAFITAALVVGAGVLVALSHAPRMMRYSVPAGAGESPPI